MKLRATLRGSFSGGKSANTWGFGCGGWAPIQLSGVNYSNTKLESNYECHNFEANFRRSRKREIDFFAGVMNGKRNTMEPVAGRLIIFIIIQTIFILSVNIEPSCRRRIACPPTIVRTINFYFHHFSSGSNDHRFNLHSIHPHYERSLSWFEHDLNSGHNVKLSGTCEPIVFVGASWAQPAISSHDIKFFPLEISGSWTFWLRSESRKVEKPQTAPTKFVFYVREPWILIKL